MSCDAMWFVLTPAVMLFAYVLGHWVGRQGDQYWRGWQDATDQLDKTLDYIEQRRKPINATEE